MTGLRKRIDYYNQYRTDNLEYMAEDRRDGEASRSLVQKAAREPGIHQLRLFLVLAQELHFGRAATRLFITRPAWTCPTFPGAALAWLPKNRNLPTIAAIREAARRSCGEQ